MTTNIINGMIYIGVHSTFNINDNYLGSGKYLKRAINSYGEHNFKRDILYYCLTIDDAYIIESKIVDEHFISKSNTYNIKIGGDGGFDYINELSSEWRKVHSKRISEGLKKSEKANKWLSSVKHKQAVSDRFAVESVLISKVSGNILKTYNSLLDIARDLQCNPSNIKNARTKRRPIGKKMKHVLPEECYVVYKKDIPDFMNYINSLAI
jgi:hypothetical protein